MKGVPLEPKSELEKWLDQYGANLNHEAKNALRTAVYEMMRAEPEHTTFEMCPHCVTEVEIPAYRASLCPECGERIVPCNECQQPCDWMEQGGCSRFPK
jgi:DNA-directed RNA polymerase subunit RPC12/RpoP